MISAMEQFIKNDMSEFLKPFHPGHTIPFAKVAICEIDTRWLQNLVFG